MYNLDVTPCLFVHRASHTLSAAMQRLTFEPESPVWHHSKHHRSIHSVVVSLCRAHELLKRAVNGVGSIVALSLATTRHRVWM
jgi:hypothetical protein